MSQFEVGVDSGRNNADVARLQLHIRANWLCCPIRPAVLRVIKIGAVR
jgi:hypothetical protein